MNLETIVESERSQTPGPQMVGFHAYEMSKEGKSMETRSRWLAAWGGGEVDHVGSGEVDHEGRARRVFWVMETSETDLW